MIDCKEPASFNHRSCTLANGHTYHYVDQPSARNPDKPAGTGVLLHGFPDSWFGWRYQIKALSEAGFRIIANSQLGYQPSSQPDDLKSYGYRALSADLAELLDEVMGGLLTWRFAAYYPERVKAVAVVCTPYLPPANESTRYVAIEDLVEKSVPTFGYQVTVAHIFGSGQKPPRLSKTIWKPSLYRPSRKHHLREPPPPPKAGKKPWSYAGEFQKRMQIADGMRQRGETTVTVPKKEEDPECIFYLESFKKGGIKHPLNYYKTRRICYDEERSSGISTNFPSAIPALFFTGTNDAALPLTMSDLAPKYFGPGQYRREVFAEADHWILQDARYRDKVCDMLVQWATTQSEQETTKAKL
ncbi:MAG: hypothetical protein CYPHOPRED_000767 [Cyphobasidiales sp. Tagirdzhanova-0007]|nr:MAG: hypothetical protein CYPHOPRED_000767 [Cyphobasidiales sp. Tagirdzhanova-0007]